MWRLAFLPLALLQPTGSVYMSVALGAVPWSFTPLSMGIGLAPNATIQVNLRTLEPSPDACLVLLTESEAEVMASEPARRIFWRRYVSSKWRACLHTPVDATFNLVGAVDPDRYVLGLLQTKPAAAHGLFGEIGYQNPGGSHLSLQQEHMPSVLGAMVWAFMLSPLVMLPGLMTRRGTRSQLHCVLMAWVNLKTTATMLAYQDYSELARTGRRSTSVQAIWTLLMGASRALDILIFYLLACGWKVTRPSLRRMERVLLFFMTLSSLMSSLGESVCLSTALCPAEPAFVVQSSLSALSLLMVLTALNISMWNVTRSLHEAAALNEANSHYAKLHKFTQFRNIFMFYITASPAIGILTSDLISWRSRWLVSFVHELVQLIVYTSILWVFKPGSVRLFEGAPPPPAESSGEESEDVRESLQQDLEGLQGVEMEDVDLNTSSGSE